MKYVMNVPNIYNTDVIIQDVRDLLDCNKRKHKNPMNIIRGIISPVSIPMREIKMSVCKSIFCRAIINNKSTIAQLIVP